MTHAKQGVDDRAAAGHGDVLGDLPRAETTPAPQCTRDGDDLHLEWPDASVRIDVTAIREPSEGATAEFAVSVHGIELHWSRLALASAPAGAQFVKCLAQRYKALPWGTIVEQACRVTVRRVREGTPAVRLTGAPLSGPRYAVEPLWWHEGLSMLYADVGSLKGFVGLVAAMVAATGRTLAGLHSRLRAPVNVLILDWESSQGDHDDRMGRLARGLGLDPAALPLYYRPMVRPLAADFPAVRATIARHTIAMLLLDSWQPACGPGRDGAADTTVATVGAVRALGLPTLAVAHLSKADAREAGPGRIYGSIFNTALCRCAWELKRDTPEPVPEDRSTRQTVLVGATHRKINNGRFRPPFALEFLFNGETGPVSVSPGDLQTAGPAVLAKLSLSSAILHLVQSGAQSTSDLAEATGKSENQVRARCAQLVKQGRLARLDAGGGAGHETRWGLPARKPTP